MVGSAARPVIMVVVALAALSGCANPRAERAVLAQTALIGMPRATLLSCAGVPPRTATEGDREYFGYVSETLVSFPTAPLFGPRWYHPYPYGYRFGAPFWPDYGGYAVDYDVCIATVTLRNGVVESLTYRGDSTLSQCYAIFESCLAVADPPRTAIGRP